jgi:hypothetical protein
MNMRRRLSLFTTIFLVFVSFALVAAPQSEAPQSPAQDGTLKALTAVAGAGALENNDYEYLREVSDDIGARVTGSPEAEKAIAWGVERMKAISLENVHTESWQLFRGWTRFSAEAELLSPVHRKLMVDSMGWAGSTSQAGVDAEVVAVNAYQLEDEVRNPAADWRGKILLLIQKGTPPSDRLATRAKFGGFLQRAHRAGALADSAYQN